MKQLGPFDWLIGGANRVGPALLPRTMSAVENAVQGTAIATFTRPGAVSPGAITIASQPVANQFQMNADGVTLEHGSVPIDYENAGDAHQLALVLQYSVGSATYQFSVTINVTNVNEAPYGPLTGTLVFPVAPGTGVSSPSPFTIGMWSIVDAGTNGDASVTISALPSANSGSLSGLEVQLASGAWVAFGSAALGTYSVPGFTDTVLTSVRIRAVKTGAVGPDSDQKTVTTTGAPAAFTAGMWSIVNDATAGDATFTLSSLPSNNGSAITALQYKIGAGAWTAFSGAGTGAYSVSGFTDGLVTNVMVRAVNASVAANGPDSDIKTVTTTSGATGIEFVGYAFATGANSIYSLSLTALTGGVGSAAQADDLVCVFVGTAAPSGVTLAGINTAVSTGYTEQAHQTSNDLRDVNARFAHKFMGSTPDTSVSILASGNTTYPGIAMAAVFRGVNLTTPLDVAYVSSGGVNSAIIDTGSVTPVTAGAWVFTGGVCSAPANAGTDITSGPTGFGAFFASKKLNTSFSAYMAGAVKNDWTSGAVNPSAFAGMATTVDDSWSGFTGALRPKP